MGYKDGVPEDRDPMLEELQAAVRDVTDDPYVEFWDPKWFTHGHLKTGIAPSHRNGRVLLAGDAGHVPLPVGGQGMNNGMQDAFNLGWKLASVARGEAPDALLDSYAHERGRARRELRAFQVRGHKRMVSSGKAQQFVLRRFGESLLEPARRRRCGTGWVC